MARLPCADFSQPLNGFQLMFVNQFQSADTVVTQRLHGAEPYFEFAAFRFVLSLKALSSVCFRNGSRGIIPILNLVFVNPLLNKSYRHPIQIWLA